MKINHVWIKASDPNTVPLLSPLFILNGISVIASGNNILENTERGESTNEFKELKISLGR